MPDENEYKSTPEMKRMYDRLVQAGWLENVTDNPNDPNKGLQWFKDIQNPANDGYARFMAFNILYAELCRFGPITEDDLLMLSVLQQIFKSDKPNEGK